MTTNATLKLHVTLRRAHNIAERIAEQMKVLREEVAQLAPGTTVRGFYGEDQIRQLQAKASDAVAALYRHQSFAAAQADIRARLGRANVEAGVSTLLAKIEAKKKQLALLRSFMTHKPDADTLSAQALRDWTPPESRLASVVTVSALGTEIFKRVDGERVTLERELFALTDALAELNARKVELEIPADLAEVLGLTEPNKAADAAHA
jgi:capsule polysaccharide export protein KpsE/RkpR